MSFQPGNRLVPFLAPAVALCAAPARAQSSEGNDISIELVDPKVLRVCADPRNLPFSNDKGEGYENKIAELLAKKLGKSLAYTYYPNTTGFVRLTLMSHKCDVIIGFPQESLEDIQKTFRFIRRMAKLGVHEVAVSTFVPLPGTQLFDETGKIVPLVVDDEYCYWMAAATSQAMT